MFNEYPDVVTVPQLQQMLHIGRCSAYELLANGDIKSIRVGRKYIIPKVYVIDFINEQNK